MNATYKKLTPSPSEIFSTLHKHFGKCTVIMRNIVKEHQAHGRIPEPDAKPSEVNKVSNKHLLLLEDTKRLIALHKGGVLDSCPLTDDHMSLLKSLLGGESRRALERQGWNSNNNEDNFKILLEEVRNIDENSFNDQYDNMGITTDKQARKGGAQGTLQEDLSSSYLGVPQRGSAMTVGRAAGTSNFAGQVANTTTAVNQSVSASNPVFTGARQSMPPTSAARQNQPGQATTLGSSCYRCLQPGHFAKYCPNLRYFCAKCQVYGTHDTAHCPSGHVAQTAPQPAVYANLPNAQNNDPRASVGGGPNWMNIPDLTEVPDARMYQGTATCFVCNEVARVNKTVAVPKTHYFNQNRKMVRHLCPVLTAHGQIEERAAVLDAANICKGCMIKSLSDESHKGKMCTKLREEPNVKFKCAQADCDARAVLCAEHKDQNQLHLSDKSRSAAKLSINLAFVAASQTISQVKQLSYPVFEPTRQQIAEVLNESSGIIPPRSYEQTALVNTVKRNHQTDHLYSNLEELIGSTHEKIRDLPRGSPAFLMFMMKGEDNQAIMTIFDTAASYSLLRDDVLGQKIKATEINKNQLSAVGGIGGTQKVKNYLAVLPLCGTTDRQMISCQSVPKIVDIDTADTAGVINEVRNLHPGSLPKGADVFNFSSLGPRVPIEALIGLHDMSLQPKLILETQLGVNIYWVPIEAAPGFTQFCIGGNVPNLKAAQAQLGQDLSDQLINAYCALENGVYRDNLGNALITHKEIETQHRSIKSNLSDSNFLGEDFNMEIETIPPGSDETLCAGEEALVTNCLASSGAVNLSSEVGNSAANLKQDICIEHSILFGSLYPEITRYDSLFSVQDLVSDLYPKMEIPRKQSNARNTVNSKLFCLIRTNLIRKQAGSAIQHFYPNYDVAIDGIKAVQCGETLCLVSPTISVKQQLDHIFRDPELEGYKCPTCRFCQTCKNAGKSVPLSVKGEIENVILKNSVTIDQVHNRLVARLPLPENYKELLKPNQEDCDRRLRAQLRKLQKMSGNEKDQLRESIEKLVDRGFVSEFKDLSPEEQNLVSQEDFGFFIPTSLVFKANSLSTPSRVCLDASAKTPGGSSLNDLLPKGEIELNMSRLLQGWKAGKVGISGDLSSYYNRIKMSPEHWSVQRFRWVRDLDPDGEMVTMVVRTVIYGVRASAVLCHMGIEKLTEIHPELRDFLGSLYVDDLAKSYNTHTEADHEVTTCQDIMSKYGLEFKSGQIVMSNRAPPDQLAKNGCVGVGPHLWDPVADTYQCSTPTLYLGKPNRGSVVNLRVCDSQKADEIASFLPSEFSLRDLLSKVASNYDGGSGLLSPLIAPLRELTRTVLLQSKSTDNSNEVDWKFKPNIEQKTQFAIMTAEIKKMGNFWYPRCQIQGEVREKVGKLLVFTDSGDFESVAVYLSLPLVDGSFSCQLMTTRVYLKKLGLTVPRSELSAAARGSLIGEAVRKNLVGYDLTLHLFIDSETCLHWIANTDGVLAVFHRNRTAQITSVFGERVWHVRTHENVADDISKMPISADTVHPDSRLFNGPTWVKSGLNHAVKKGVIRSMESLAATKLDKTFAEEYEQGLCMRRYKDLNLEAVQLAQQALQIASNDQDVLSTSTAADRIIVEPISDMELPPLADDDDDDESDEDEDLPHPGGTVLITQHISRPPNLHLDDLADHPDFLEDIPPLTPGTPDSRSESDCDEYDDEGIIPLSDEDAPLFSTDSHILTLEDSPSHTSHLPVPRSELSALTHAARLATNSSHYFPIVEDNDQFLGLSSAPHLNPPSVRQIVLTAGHIETSQEQGREEHNYERNVELGLGDELYTAISRYNVNTGRVCGMMLCLETDLVRELMGCQDLLSQAVTWAHQCIVSNKRQTFRIQSSVDSSQTHQNLPSTALVAKNVGQPVLDKPAITALVTAHNSKVQHQTNSPSDQGTEKSKLYSPTGSAMILSNDSQPAAGTPKPWRPTHLLCTRCPDECVKSILALQEELLMMDRRNEKFKVCSGDLHITHLAISESSGMLDMFNNCVGTIQRLPGDQPMTFKLSRVTNFDGNICVTLESDSLSNVQSICKEKCNSAGIKYDTKQSYHITLLKYNYKQQMAPHVENIKWDNLSITQQIFHIERIDLCHIKRPKNSLYFPILSSANIGEAEVSLDTEDPLNSAKWVPRTKTMISEVKSIYCPIKFPLHKSARVVQHSLWFVAKIFKSLITS